MSLSLTFLYHLINHRGGVLSLFLVFLFSEIASGQQNVASTPIEIVGDGIQEIVNAHNLFRGMVEPPASNMQQVVSSIVKRNLIKWSMKVQQFVLQ